MGFNGEIPTYGVLSANALRGSTLFYFKIGFVPVTSIQQKARQEHINSSALQIRKMI
jgi:hypothetical protein